MAKATESGEPRGIKAEGVATVKGLAEVSRQLFPLREKANSRRKLSKRDQKKLDDLEREYRILEARIFSLMRPKEDPH